MIRSDHVKPNIQEFVNKECLRLTQVQRELFDDSMNKSNSIIVII